jgi:hypothetical protein
MAGEEYTDEIEQMPTYTTSYIQLNLSNVRQMFDYYKMYPVHLRESKTGIRTLFTNEIANKLGECDIDSLAFRAILRNLDGSDTLLGPHDNRVPCSLENALANIAKFGEDVNLDLFPDYPLYGLSFRVGSISPVYALPKDNTELTIVIAHNNSDGFYNGNYYNAARYVDKQHYRRRLKGVVVIEWS